MKLPLANAELRTVRAAAQPAERGRPPAMGTELWTASDQAEGVYYLPVDEQVIAGGTTTRVEQRVITVRAELNIAWRPGQSITVLDLRDGTEITGRIRRVEPIVFTGVPGIVRLVLEDA